MRSKAEDRGTGRKNALAGSTLSNPAMMTFACQRYQEAVWASKGGKLPTTDSKLRRIRIHRNLRSLRSLRRSLCSLCNLCNLCSRSRGLP
jgi:hypothetical protein